MPFSSCSECSSLSLKFARKEQCPVLLSKALSWWAWQTPVAHKPISHVHFPVAQVDLQMLLLITMAPLEGEGGTAAS